MSAPRTLTSLVIAQTPATETALARILGHSLEGQTLSFVTCLFDRLGGCDVQPDLIFIDGKAGLGADEALQVTRRFPRTTCVVLGECDETARREYLKAGVDEVMPLRDLESMVGVHLVEKLMAMKDLADEKRLIAQSEERFKGVIEHAHEIILLVDEEGTIVYTSPAFARQTGYEEWEVLGQEFLSFLHDADRQLAHDRFDAVLSAPASDVYALEYRFVTKAGEWRDYDANATNLLGDEMVRAIVINMRDVTLQRQAETQLEEYRQHLETLVERRTRELVEVQTRANTVIDASPDALLAMDNDGQILFISEHYKHSYPGSAEWLVPGRKMFEAYQKVSEELGIPPDDARYQTMLAWWKNPQGTTEFQMANGTWLRLRAKRMQGDRGIVVSTTNITDLKRQQELLAQQSAVLEAALETERGIVEQQKTFVSMVSHEFRTPLTIIDGNAQIIESRAETLDPPSLVRRAGTIRSAVDRLVRLIEAILSAQVMDSGQMKVAIAPCNIEEVIRAAMGEQQDIAPTHAIVGDMTGLPPVMMLDQAMIRQMMTNLLSNAVKYSPGQNRVEVQARRDGGEVIITVRDFGVGIPARELPKIATKYFRASTSSGIPGTGLGLNLVRQFAELHGGRLLIDSTEGQGTTMTIVLPVREG